MLERAMNQRAQAICYGEKSAVVMKSLDGINYIDVADYSAKFVDWNARGEGEERVSTKTLAAIKSEAANTLAAISSGKLSAEEQNALLLAMLAKMTAK
jgi:hypothetical protein